jgi:hypothetical protein
MFRRFVVLCSLWFCAAPSSGDDLYGPVLGMIADVPRSALWPIRGIPGAASIGEAVDLGAGANAIFLAPHQNRAFLVTGLGTLQASLAPDGTFNTADAGLPAGFRPAVASFNPTGSVAAFYDPVANELWLKNDAARQIDLSQLPGPFDLLAVSDRADVPLAGTLRGARQSVVVLDSQGGYRSISGFTEVTDVAFADADLVVADGGAKRVLLVRGPGYDGEPDVVLELAGAPDGPFHIASSADGNLVAVLAAADPGKRAMARTPAAIARRPVAQRNPVLGLLRLADHRWTPVECDCAPVGLLPLKGNSVYRLTERIDQPLWILDGDAPAARVLFIPAVQK